MILGLHIRALLTAAWCLLLAVAAPGCTNYNRDLEDVVGAYRAGRFNSAAEELLDMKGRSQDRLLLALERGKALQDAGRFRESVEVFDKADAKLDEMFRKSDLRVTQELGAMVLEQTVREYTGTLADGIMLSTYQAINHLCLGDLREARVHLRRAHDRQQESVAINAKRIAQAQAQSYSNGIDVDRTLAGTALDPSRGSAASLPDRAYADYVNPMTSWLSGLVLMLDGDWSNAQVDLRKVQAMTRYNPYVESELRGLGYIESAQQGRPIVYVILEAGMAPRLDPVHIPFATRASGVSMLSLPALQVAPPLVSGITLSPPGSMSQAIATDQIASNSALIATEFNNRLPLLLIRTALSVAGKEAATQALRSEMGDAGLVIGSLWKLAASSADLRTWRTAGATFSIAHLPRPAGGVLNLDVIGTGGGRRLRQAVEIPDAPVSIIFARTTGPDHLVATVSPLYSVSLPRASMLAAPGYDGASTAPAPPPPPISADTIDGQPPSDEFETPVPFELYE